MPRPTRIGVVMTGIAAVTGLLAGCDRPVPEVTLLAGNKVTQVTALKYCFDAGNRNCHQHDRPQTITVASASTILVDVPRSVARSHWLVSAFQLDASTGKKTALDGNGSAGLLHDTHSTRVSVPYGTGDYYLSVAQIEGTEQRGTWTVRVRVVPG
ncbi:MAG: DUF2771 family protein [Actinomycetota bacterium]